MSVDRRAFLAGSSRLLSASLLAAGIPAAAEAENQPQTAKRKYRLIATEEAFSIPEQADEFRKIAPIAYSNPDLDMWRSFVNAPPGASPLLRRLLDLEGERIQIMDQAGVDMHLLSLTSPGVQMFDPDTATSIATTANDRLAEMVNKHPKRFAGLASFAPQDPKRAAKEIDRAMNQLKLNGLIVNSHTDGEYLDDRKYWPIFEAATACNAALYIHPRNMPDPCAFMLHATPPGRRALGLSDGNRAARHEADRGRGIRSVSHADGGAGHMGEALPYWLYRIDYMYKVYTRGNPKIKKLPSQYVKDNIRITTSGMFDHKVLKYCNEALGAGEYYFAIDYPYQESVEAANFMNSSPLSEADNEKIAHGNAEKLFRIATA